METTLNRPTRKPHTTTTVEGRSRAGASVVRLVFLRVPDYSYSYGINKPTAIFLFQAPYHEHSALRTESKFRSEVFLADFSRDNSAASIVGLGFWRYGILPIMLPPDRDYFIILSKVSETTGVQGRL